MTESLSKHERNLSALIHASTLSRFFIPFGNFLFPLLLWTGSKKEHSFVDYNGKRVLNFQISMFLYSVILGMLSFPFLLGMLPGLFKGGILTFDHFDPIDAINLQLEGNWLSLYPFIWPLALAILLQIGLFLINIIYTILACIRTNEGQYFNYPLSIPFIR